MKQTKTNLYIGPITSHNYDLCFLSWNFLVYILFCIFIRNIVTLDKCINIKNKKMKIIYSIGVSNNNFNVKNAKQNYINLVINLIF